MIHTTSSPLAVVFGVCFLNSNVKCNCIVWNLHHLLSIDALDQLFQPPTELHTRTWNSARFRTLSTASISPSLTIYHSKCILTRIFLERGRCLFRAIRLNLIVHMLAFLAEVVVQPPGRRPFGCSVGPSPMTPMAPLFVYVKSIIFNGFH